MKDETTFLLQWLSDQDRKKARRILIALANETIKRIAIINPHGGDDVRRVPAYAVAKAAGFTGDERGATKWLSWPLVQKWWDTRAGKMHAEAFAAGLSQVANPHYESGSGSGNISECWLEFIPVGAPQPAPALDADREVDELDDGEFVIRYQVTPPEQIKLGLRARLLFHRGRITTGTWRWWILLLILLGPILGGVVLLMLLSVVSLLDKTAVAVKDLWLIALAAGGFLYFRTSIAIPWTQLTEDRIVSADDFLAWKELHGQVELLRDGEKRHLRFVRYSTSCPVCDTTVQLAKGGSDFPGRLVGRCVESPHEHVFSFDRVTLTGGVLRAPPSWTRKI